MEPQGKKPGRRDEDGKLLQNGTLLLFPAYLPHSVDANTSEAERISLSFNLMFSSFTETLSKPLW